MKCNFLASAYIGRGQLPEDCLALLPVDEPTCLHCSTSVASNQPGRVEILWKHRMDGQSCQDAYVCIVNEQAVVEIRLGTYQQSIISLYKALGQPGGGGNR